jgi:hypothetical protein
MGCMGAYASVGMIIVMLGMDLSPTSFTFDEPSTQSAEFRSSEAGFVPITSTHETP